MTRLYRGAHIPALLVGMVVVANCSSTSPPEAGDCQFRNAQDEAGTLLCLPLKSSGGSAGGTGMGGLKGLPDLGGPKGQGGGGSSGGPLGTGGALTGSGGATGGSGGIVAAGGIAGSPVSVGGSISSGGTGGAVASGGTDAGVGGSVPLGGGGGDPSTSGGSMGSPVGNVFGRIQVDAGATARERTIVSFPLPGAEGKSLALKDSAGNQLALQLSPIDGNASFVLPSLAAGQQAAFTIEELPEPPPQVVTSFQEGDHLFLAVGENRVFRWTLVEDNFANSAANNVRKGYIYPLYTPSGLNVADDYAPDHPHMHGIWSAWTSTTFRNHPVDFWNGYANQGHVDLESMDGIWSGAVHAGLVANLKHTDITANPPVDALKEKWVVTVYKTHDAAAPYFVIDIDSTQVTAGNDPLVLEQYHYGGFGFRGSAQWRTVGSVEYITSEGHTRANGDGKTARWCAQYGNVDGKPAGYAALGHKDNPRHPQGLRIHPTNPYWSFTATTPASGGRLTIETGKPYHSRFRIVVFDGQADAALLNRLWDDFSTPPTVQVLPP